MNNNITLNKQANEFLLYSYFGIVDYDTPETIIRKCVKRAYLDLNRTLTMKKDKPEQSFMNEYVNLLSNALQTEGTVSDKRDAAYQLFKSQEKEMKDYLKMETLAQNSKKRNDRCFYYGQAQKWINMSLKYMWLLGLVQEDDVNGDYLEAPIDNFIFNAAAFDNKEMKYPIDIDNPTGSENKKYHALNENTMPWSKLDKSEYEYIQNQIKNNIQRKGTIIEWECDAWIKASERVKRGEAITEARKARKLSFTEVYKKIDISRNLYSRIEHGYCTVDKKILRKLSELLDSDFQ